MVGTYRDDQLEATHPMALILATQMDRGTPVPQIDLAPMNIATVNDWLTDALHRPPEEALLTAIYQKTDGNPFFIKAFMSTLIDEGLLFHDVQNGWQWHLAEIEQLQVTDNVAELKARQIIQFPDETSDILLTAACFGSSFDLQMVATVSKISQEQAYIYLQPALQASFLLKRGQTYRFAHDRIHEAACSLMDEPQKMGRHLSVACLLWAQIAPTTAPPSIIVDQFNAALPLVSDQSEKTIIAQLNLQAGQKALKATAYETAVSYL